MSREKEEGCQPYSYTVRRTAQGNNQCAIIQDKMSIAVPFKPPSFLTNPNKTQCQEQNKGQEMLRCGNSDLFIKPECVCSFYNVYEATLYHKYSSCPRGEGSDVITQLKCPDCQKYSLNNNGPCINGGKLTCKGDEVAPYITCECPPNYQGKFCEEKIENVTRLCDKISASSAIRLTNCDSTKHECVTYSRTRKYVYRCRETETSQDRQGLPLCIDTEDITVSPEVRTSTRTSNTTTTTTTESSQRNYYISESAVQSTTPTPAVILVLVVLKLWFIN
ncbi:uncharacterized protein LOC128190127 isoform X3 [Crassostrea angulata]|uniref:uncharacterized protein LOC128190127 isoform X3 n=1 Tax=Magallana angulata TaxID=2784310 RepID=UPI0022B0D511|nr:uncharacterized protein LOC128190127 isoform X3 [Crassostrea angulata]